MRGENQQFWPPRRKGERKKKIGKNAGEELKKAYLPDDLTPARECGKGHG